MDTDLMDTHHRSLNRLVTEKRQGPKSLAHSSVPAHPLDHQSTVQPDDKVPSCPGSSIAQARPAANFRVAPNPLLWPGLAAGAFSGYPESCIDGRVDDESLPDLELCILSSHCG
jgi:hypothetical protein